PAPGSSPLRSRASGFPTRPSRTSSTPSRARSPRTSPRASASQPSRSTRERSSSRRSPASRRTPPRDAMMLRPPGEVVMDWIEELFGISPDAGSGTLEALIAGAVVAVKDLFATKGIRTTAGSRILKDWVPEDDATVVRKLREAGAVLLGKLGMHEFAYGISSVNPHFGDVRNPWDTTKIPGGSSGGS